MRYFVKIPLQAFIFLFFHGLCQAQENALWLRNPAISPDGKTIVFGYKGDLYKVDAKGGDAVPLTIHEAHDMMPVWSHDGKSIAFASNRHGNFDVFVMPVTGGTPLRLTYNSFSDYPYDFAPGDSAVLFTSGRNAPAESVRFSSPRLFLNLYKVPVTGGRALLVSAAGMQYAHYNGKGTQIVFEDRKGYEDALRKHHISSVTRDIWIMDVKNKTYRQISGFAGEDREPVFSSDDQYIYYLSEKEGNQNIYKTPVLSKVAEVKLTSFTDNPVRHLSRSDNNTLCFTQDGEIYTFKEGSTPEKISIRILNDGRAGVSRNVPVNGNITEFELSPNGKEIAFVTRGEVFVTSVEGSETKRITNTPQQERMVKWAPDGRSLVYAAERNDNWDIYRVTIARADEPYFYASTLLKEEPVIATPAEEYQPIFSPDGKELAFIEERNILKIYNLASGKSRTVLPEGRNYSYRDGDWSFSWSADGKWLVADDQRGFAFRAHAALIKTDSSTNAFYPVNGGFEETIVKWNLGGRMLTWISSKQGRQPAANQGNYESDVYAVFFDKASYDRYKLSKDDFTLVKEREEKEKKADSIKKKTNPVFKPDLEGLYNRQVRLTINSSTISDYVLNEDASKLYYLSSFEKGYDVWVTEPRTRETKILAKLEGTPSTIMLSKDGKTLFVNNKGGLVKINTESGKLSPVQIDGEMVLDAFAERGYMVDHICRQVEKKFYDPSLHGVAWKKYKQTYARFLPHISNNFDFQELLSELLGELNASHTGGRYSPEIPDGDNTASLGLLYDDTYSGKGIKVSEVIAGGPSDKAGSRIVAQTIIEKIDGEELLPAYDWNRALNRKVGKNTLLSLYNQSTGARWEETIKPVSYVAEAELMYKRWVKMMEDKVNKLSAGKLGYVHVRAMNDESYRDVVDNVMGKNLDKQALIVDTRFNGGGWLHDDLKTLLSGKEYLKFESQGHPIKGGEPITRWNKPSCVIMSEGNYSDAFIFPYIYKQDTIGKLIGMPVAGTGTAVWWERQIDPTIVFGIPMIGTIGKEKRPTENLQVEPDITVPLKYENFLNGKDDQLEAAVKEMMRN